MGLAYRTDFDLSNIQRESGKSMEYRDKVTGETFIPHVIEPSIGVERLFLAILTAAYRQDGDRIVLKLPENLAPYKFCVSPLLKNKPELVAKAQEVYQQLKQKYTFVTWDDSGNIGKRYKKQDEIGTPKCVVIDFDTLEDDTVTVRDRDTTEQTRVQIADLQKGWQKTKLYQLGRVLTDPTPVSKIGNSTQWVESPDLAFCRVVVF